MARVRKEVLNFGERLILAHDWLGLDRLLREHFPTEKADWTVSIIQDLMSRGPSGREQALKFWHLLDTYDRTRAWLVGPGIKLGIVLGCCGGIAYLVWTIFG